MNPTTLLALIARPTLHEYAIALARQYRDLVGRDEARSAADEGIVEACGRYRPERGPFLPFARLWVLRQIHRAIRREVRWRRRMVMDGADFGELLDERTDGEGATIRKQVENVLGEEGFQLWARHAEEGDTLREIARGYGVSIRQVRRKVSESHARIKAILEEDVGPRPQGEPIRAKVALMRERRRRSGRW